MKIKREGNSTVVTLRDLEVLFSYNTPVAGFVAGKGYFKTDRFYSPTTSKHINAYVRGDAMTVSQDWIEDLLNTLRFEVPGGIGLNTPWEVQS